MKRLIIVFCLFAFSMSAQASLHPGWKEAGWLTNYDVALKKAKATNQPIFLYFDASWCSWCQQFKREVLDVPKVQRALARHYVRLVIDYDARPDLFNHYKGRGLPFTVILAPDGSVQNRFVGILKIPDMLAILKQFRKTRTVKTPVDSFPFEPVYVTGLDAKAYRRFRKAFLQYIDSLYSKDLKTLAGQYETGATLKRPSPLTWMWLLEQKTWRKRALVAAKVEAQRLWDPVGSGFFQYLHIRSTAPDYIESSKLLEVNAHLSHWMALVSAHDRTLTQHAKGGVNYLLKKLRDPKTGAFFQAQIADQAYYRLSPKQRRRKPEPALDRVIRLDTNAQAVIALIGISRQLKDPALLATAERVYDFLLNGMIDKGVRYHLYVNGRLEVPALLADELWLLAAGLALQGEKPDQKRKVKLQRLLLNIQIRIGKIMKAKTNKEKAVGGLTTELYGLSQ